MTKTLQEIQEFNCKKIICAVNGAKNYDEALEKELGVGCVLEKVKVAGKEIGWAEIIKDELERCLYVILSYGHTLETYVSFSDWEHNTSYEIIGKPLTLDRVLLALGELETDVSVCCYGNIRIGHEITNLPRWDLTKPTLEQQSEETQRAIYELLGGENE